MYGESGDTLEQQKTPQCQQYEDSVRWITSHQKNYITPKEITAALRAAVISIGEDILGIKAKEVGTHLIRSGAAMSMYLGKYPVYTIMMIGRWSSDAFLLYIRKQVKQFSHNVSIRMLRFELFSTEQLRKLGKK